WPAPEAAAVLNRRAPPIFSRRWRRTEFCAAPGSAFVAWADAIRGEAAVPTQFRQERMTCFLVGTPRCGVRVPFWMCIHHIGRRSAPSLPSVNSPAGNDYGSPSMDCHNRLRHRVDLVVRLHRFAFASTSAGAGGRVSHAGDDSE